MAENNEQVNESIIRTDIETDAANKSLTDALKISFAILKIIMLVLIGWFFASGIFSVEENEVAMVLFLGRLQEYKTDSGEESAMLTSGLHWTFPTPISEIVKIPVKKTQTLQIDNFWYVESDLSKLREQGYDASPGQLDPLFDGYCFTRSDSQATQSDLDYNLVHCKWRLTYKISDPQAFFKNVFYELPGPGQDYLDVASKTIDPLLKSLTCDSIVATMVKYTIDEALVNKGDIDDKVSALLRKKLERINFGIEIVAVDVQGKITWPRQVNNAFLASTKASQTKQQKIAEASGYARRILNETGGTEADQILTALKDPTVSSDQKEQMLLSLPGLSRETISQARAYRTKMVSDAKANADYLMNLLPEYRARPRLVLQRIYQDAMEEIFSNSEEKVVIRSVGDKPKELRILINRDPEISKNKEKEEQAKTSAGAR